MNRLTFFTDSKFDAGCLRRQVADLIEVRCVGLEEIPHTKPDHLTLVGAALNDSSRLLGLKEWIRSRPKDAKVIFLTDAHSRVEATRAFAIGATDVVHRPIDGRALLRKHAPDVVQMNSALNANAKFHIPECPAAMEATGGLESMFSAVALGEPVETGKIEAVAAEVVDEIEAKGFACWIDAVRRHHSQTYQHCLLVTGAAVAFAGHLRLSTNDRNRLSFAAMLHD